MSIVEYEQLQEVQEVTETEKRARTLEAAALEIEMRGWTQGYCEDETGAVCMAGALAHAVYGSADHHASFHTLHTTWFGSPPLDVRESMRLPLWNDGVAKYPEDVTTALRERAAEIRAGR